MLLIVYGVVGGGGHGGGWCGYDSVCYFLVVVVVFVIFCLSHCFCARYICKLKINIPEQIANVHGTARCV